MEIRMMLQLNLLRKEKYQAIAGQRSGLSGRPHMLGRLAASGSLSGSDFGRFDCHSAVSVENLIDKPNRLIRTNYALFPPGGNRKMEV